MLSLDQQRCGYCGGCVALCPVRALELAELSLQIDQETCIGCGSCVQVCSSGALSLERSRASSARSALSGKTYDLVVIGGGPAGSVCAASAASRGLRVLLLEKRQEIGSPVRCAEGIGRGALERIGDPEPQCISARVNGTRIVSGEEVLDFEAPPEATKAGYVLERRIFDRRLAEKAGEAGARIITKATVTGLLREGTRIVGVAVEHRGRQYEVATSLVVAADGVESAAGRWAGIDCTLAEKDTLCCAQLLLTDIEIDPRYCVYHIDENQAPDGYFWIFPKGPQMANVGVGIQGDRVTESPFDVLVQFIENMPKLARGTEVTSVYGNVSVGLPPSRLVADGFMLVGDAARQVDPLTGGGIANAMEAGLLAGEVAARAVSVGDYSAAFLSAYERRWRDGTGHKIERNYRIKEKLGGQRRSHHFLRAFAAATTG